HSRNFRLDSVEVYVKFLFLMSTTAFPCCKDTTFKRIIRISLTFDYNNRTSQTLMIVSKDDLECIVQNAIDKLLEQRENKPEIFLTAEETAKRLKVDRSTLWRWNKEGYLVANKVGSKVRYKLSDVERIQKGELI
ncbi:helix-turn-helix domain-containing protein, partial [uncultured Bacteroides sp.]|uniref:helix-turn-helix domain-containing protein n=1 Tax=uncultured Bacteroides sp. TaxID=162156 RepID=UPI0034590DC0